MLSQSYQRYIKLNGDQQMIKTITITMVIFRVRRLALPNTSMFVLRRVTEIKRGIKYLPQHYFC